MNTEIDTTTAAEVFAAARTGTVRRTTMGRHVDVKVGRYEYRMEIPERYLVCITSREGHGGVEYMTVNATPEQDAAVRKAHGI
ncbi:hypothetical protein [Actinomadura opuntiae]|uniref:hypothetical protein n=1 Tax=Actinomadura sp. OS1-43 TaxID=604315 RepID=UPI00255A83CD|nr:hypothetical protein [Actinomadura sp. OS1-43]MDL4812797.1 hypothetical protein [Actinomadura sp. OS1-43]